MTTPHSAPSASVTRTTLLRRGPGATAALVAATVLSACYNYVPTERAAPAAGQEVRLTLTDLGSAQLTGALGARVETVDGYLEPSTGDSLVIRATRTVVRGGNESAWNGERVALPSNAVASVALRRFSRSRTLLAAAIGIGLAVAAVIAASALNASNGGDTIDRLPGQQ